MVSPYGWDVPGGVQVHIKELAEHLITLGNEVSVIAPVADESSELEPWLVSAGRPVPIPFNGSVARVLFGPIAASRVRQWIEAGEFDLLHLHEPGIPSLSLLACWSAEGAMVGTFHASTARLRAISAASGLIQPMIEKLGARIAVSQIAHDTMVSLYETSGVIIPNGIDYTKFALDKPKIFETNNRIRIGFLGRFEEERKGLHVFLEAINLISQKRADVEFLVAGPGDAEKFANSNVQFLGRLSEEQKIEYLQSLDIYVAPNTGGESFGIILIEAMAAGAAVVASDIPAFSAVLEGGALGVLFKNGEPTELARMILELVREPTTLSAFSHAGSRAAKAYDWNSVAVRILSVYETAMAGQGKVGLGNESAAWKRGR